MRPSSPESQNKGQATPVPLATQTPYPTPTPYPTYTSFPTITEVPPTATLSPSDTPAAPPTAAPTTSSELSPEEIQAKVKSANVLVFEDMTGNYDRLPLVHQAVNEMNFSGGKVLEVKDALGTFKENLLGTTHWDLIIVAAEYREGVQGEFWGYLYDQVKKGAALIIEVWYIDKHPDDFAPLFGDCGISYQKDWVRGAKYNMLDYSIFWLAPDHEFFAPPQQPVSLVDPSYIYWAPPLTTDAGDLIQLASGGDATILAGTQPGQKTSYGVLATCLKGQMIVQTFSSHDYKESEVVKLWKNSMLYTLTNHFKVHK